MKIIVSSPFMYLLRVIQFIQITLKNILMDTILVPTDFSENSKGGIRFAINIAAYTDTRLLFIYVAPIVYKTDPNMSYEHFGINKDEQSLSLKNFVEACYQEMGVKPKLYDCTVISGLRADLALLRFCTKSTDITHISISTRGASGLSRRLGTNTGNLVTKSCIPVFVVPTNYRPTPLKSVLYASDLQDYKREIQEVLTFVEPFKANLDVLHLTSTPEDISTAPYTKSTAYPVDFHITKKDILQPFITQLLKEVERLKPSVLVLFTRQNRSFLEKLFPSILAEELAFHPKVPMLIFSKIKETAGEPIS